MDVDPQWFIKNQDNTYSYNEKYFKVKNSGGFND